MRKGGEMGRLRSRVRTVTRMLVLVVTCYLAANIIDVLIAFWETIDIESLYHYPGLYAVLTDISSFLPILACALRLPIYAMNDKQIRLEVRRKMQTGASRLCVCCPSVASWLRMRKKLYDPEIEAERLFQTSSSAAKESLAKPHLEVKTYGMGSLIMARASLSTQSELREIARFRERMDVLGEHIDECDDFSRDIPLIS